jgi:hypothetical protein
MRAIALVGLCILIAASGARSSPVMAAVSPTKRPAYGVLYTAWIKAGKPHATVRIRLTRHPEWVRWMRLDADPSRYTQFTGSGTITIKGSEVLWHPPAADAWLQYSVLLESKRASGRYDGLIGESWALFRGDDLVPPIHLDMQDGTQSQAKLRLNLPPGWSAETRFPRYHSGRLRIDNPARLFDRPTGWMLLGDIGTRRERIGDTRVAVAAPKSQDVRRMDILALFRFSLPVMQKIFPNFPERLLVVSAGDPMWRGALSGPDSLFVHADRPLISENGTSTVIHELVHIAMSARSTPGADWIVEGLAEYYSLQVLLRSGAISSARFETAHRKLALWGQQAPALDAPRSTGPVTARAVGVLRTIDTEIRAASHGKASLDDVVREMASDPQPVTLSYFRTIADRVAGAPVTAVPR